MEIIQGKSALLIDACALADRLAGYRHTLIDIGTGDGRFVRHTAETQPGMFAIGVDACRENLRNTSRRAPRNALFAIANAQTLPRELYGLATHMTINFPWGSLLNGLLMGNTALLGGLSTIAPPGARIESPIELRCISRSGLGARSHRPPAKPVAWNGSRSKRLL